METSFAIAMMDALMRRRTEGERAGDDRSFAALRAPSPAVPQMPAPEVAPEPAPTSSSQPAMPLGKITSYNWKGDPYTDSNSRKWIGSWGRISEIGMAVSPDVERKFRAAGIEPKDRVEIELSDGTKLLRVWDNRTMQDAQAIRKFGKPLTGRFDLHHPYGKKAHEKDGIAVVGFKKYSAVQ